jgi:hypothetical protein
MDSSNSTSNADACGSQCEDVELKRILDEGAAEDLALVAEFDGTVGDALD